MVVHQAVGEAHPALAADDVFEQHEVPVAVEVVEEDPPPVVPARVDVLNGSSKRPHVAFAAYTP
jgi:hypothetical protein